MSIKKKVMVLVSICIIVLIGCLIGDKIMSKSYLNEIKYNEVIEKFENKENFVLLISQTDCSHCISYKPKLKDVANEHKINIYYIDIDLLNKDEKEKLESYVGFDSTPITTFIKNGEETTVANRINGDASKEKIEKKLKSNGFID